MAPKLHVPHKSSHTKGTSLGCQLAPNQFTSPKIVPFELYPYHKQPLNYPFLAVLGPGNHHCTHADTDSCLLFQKWSKSVQNKWPKGHVGCMTENKTAPLGRTPGETSPNFCEYTPWHLIYIPGFIQICSGFGELQPKNSQLNAI